MICRQFKVSGRVQGVFFRASTRDVAMPLNITGHAINLPDGSVEVLACGDRDSVEKLARWLEDGPRMATVAGVESHDVDCAAPTDFRIG